MADTRAAAWPATEASGVVAYGIAEPVELTYFGRSTVLVGIDGVRLLTDPSMPGGPGFSLTRRAPRRELPEVDVVLVSHGHGRHLSIPTIRRLPGRPRILAPAPQAAAIANAGVERVEAVEPGDVVMAGRVAIQAVAAAHGAIHAALAPHQNPVGFLVQGSSSIYFAGDSVPSATPDAVNGVDIALLPVAPVLQYVGHLSPSDAAETARLAAPRVVIPVHWAEGFDELTPAWLPRRENFTPERLEAALRRAFDAAGVTADLRMLEPGYSTAVLPPAGARQLSLPPVVAANVRRRQLPHGTSEPA